MWTWPSILTSGLYQYVMSAADASHVYFVVSDALWVSPGFQWGVAVQSPPWGSIGLHEPWQMWPLKADRLMPPSKSAGMCSPLMVRVSVKWSFSFSSCRVRVNLNSAFAFLVPVGVGAHGGVAPARLPRALRLGGLFRGRGDAHLLAVLVGRAALFFSAL